MKQRAGRVSSNGIIIIVRRERKKRYSVTKERKGGVKKSTN